jgi:aminoimidazole riboside kinase
VRLETDKPILCAGALQPDFIVAPGVRDGARLLLGGTSGNTAYGLARLGVETMILAKVGADFYGRLLRDDMVVNGVDATCVSFHDTAPTMINIAVVQPAGERFMFTWPEKGSALWEISSDDVPDEVVSRVGWVHFCGATTERDPAGATFGQLAERCAEAGVIVSIDLNLRPECFGWNDEYAANVKRIIDVANVVFGSRRDEFQYFSTDPRELVTQRRLIVARDGRAGATVHSSDGDYSAGVYELPIADTVGAGDIFDSGFIAAAVSGRSLGDCLTWGNACGGYSIQFEGGRACLDRAGLAAFLEEHETTTSFDRGAAS